MLWLRAKWRVPQAGRTNSVGAADICIVSTEQETLCGTVPGDHPQFSDQVM
jgi:hypothetical protein